MPPTPPPVWFKFPTTEEIIQAMGEAGFIGTGSAMCFGKNNRIFFIRNKGDHMEVAVNIASITTLQKNMFKDMGEFTDDQIRTILLHFGFYIPNKDLMQSVIKHFGLYTPKGVFVKLEPHGQLNFIHRLNEPTTTTIVAAANMLLAAVEEQYP